MGRAQWEREPPGGSEVCMDNGPLDRKGSNWLMGRLGLDLLIPVHCPLVTECHSTSLPNGCQGDQANTTAAGSPKPNPHPTKLLAANRKGKAGYDTAAWEEGSEKGDTRSSPLLSTSPKKNPMFLTSVQRGTWGQEDACPGKGPTASQTERSQP